MSLAKEREQLRSEISAFCKKLVLSQRAVELCEKEATPKHSCTACWLKRWKTGNAADAAGL